MSIDSVYGCAACGARAAREGRPGSRVSRRMPAQNERRPREPRVGHQAERPPLPGGGGGLEAFWACCREVLCQPAHVVGTAEEAGRLSWGAAHRTPAQERD